MIVRIKICGSDPSSKVISNSRYSIAAQRRFVCDNGANFCGQCRWNTLVRVERKNPVVSRFFCRKVLLVDISGPIAAENRDAFGARNVERRIGAARIDEENLVCPLGAVYRGRDVFGFVERNDRDRDFRHDRILTRSQVSETRRYGERSIGLCLRVAVAHRAAPHLSGAS